jgi:hypothetical protein
MVNPMWYAYGINGDSGNIEWSTTTAGSSVWALEQIDDITGDGIKDVIVGDFHGNIYGLDATSGSSEFTTSIGTVIIQRFEKLDDVNGDTHPDIIPAHSTISITQVIDGYTGDIIWSQPVADQPWKVDRIEDITGDAINDVIVGTLYQDNYCYFFDGVNGTELKVISYGEAVDAIGAVADVVGDWSMEMLAGGRNGKLTCYSGGKNASGNPIKLIADFSADPTHGGAPLTVDFTDLSITENTTITSWEWDFTNDGIIDSTDQHPTWTYENEGTYSVKLKISDGVRTDTEIKQDYIQVVPTSLEIQPITGGLFKIHTKIHNTGEAPLTMVTWNMQIDGGTIILGKETSGTIDIINEEETIDISSNLILGLGKTTIIVSAESSEGVTALRSKLATILFIYIYVPPGGGI